MVFIKSIVFVALFTLNCRVNAGGGVAELKSLTGDAPYMGFGNQEQAPEYFGDALVRQYYTNPSYGYAPSSPYSTYNMRNAYYGGAYQNGAYQAPYYQQGVGGGMPASPVVSQQAVSGGGFYQGGGNDWVKSRK